MKSTFNNIIKLLPLALLLLVGIANGQKKEGFIPPSIDDEDIPVAKTELPVPEEGQDYVVKYFKGTTDGIESRIAIKKLGYILRPAMVQVFSEDGRELAIELVKKNWDDVVRSGFTKNGKFQTSFKTAMEFGIKISASEMGIPFIVAVSAGVELFPASNLFVDASTMKSDAGSVTDSIEADSLPTNTGSSISGNSSLTIIIIIALVVILILLMLLVIKKRKKGATTLIVLFLLSSFAYAGLPTQVLPQFAGSISGGFMDALFEHYKNGGFKGDHPLSEDDKDHEPEADPRGQPSLPSSCYDIARISQSGGSSGSNGLKGGSQSKNPTGDMGTGGVAGGNTGNTLSIGSGPNIGSSVGSGTGSDASPGSQDNSENNTEYQARIEELQQEMERGIEETRSSYQQGLEGHTSNYEHILRTTREDYTQRITEAVENGNNEENLRLIKEYEERQKELAELNARRIDNLQKQRDRLIEGHIAYFNDRLLEIMEEQAEDRRQNEGKDPNRDPQKDKDREEDAKGGGKGVGDPGGSNGPGGLGDGDPGGGENNNDNEGCDCLERAYKELQDNRHTLEKLLKIGQHTKKVTDFGISFGDNFSGVHAVSGLVWQTERVKVLKSMEKFNKTYDNKYKELIDKLYNTLIWIDDCEKQLGYENWYSNSGFIYYEFMKVRYASYK